MTTENDRPEMSEKASVPAKRRRNAEQNGADDAVTLATRINYVTRDGTAISTSLDRIKNVDEIVPSGIFDAPQASKEDVEGQPIVIIDGMRMTGKYGPWYISYAAYADEFSLNPAECEKFTVPFNGSVLPMKMAAILAQDLETGRAISGKTKSLPAVGKLVRVEGADNEYWDFRAPGWTPGVEIEKPKFSRR